MIKVYKKLSQSQKDKGVVFTSTLSLYRFETTQDTTHEVLNTDTDKEQKISRLLNDKFFNQANLWKYNIIRQ